MRQISTGCDVSVSVCTSFCRPVIYMGRFTAEICLDLRTETHCNWCKPGRISGCYNYLGFSMSNCENVENAIDSLGKVYNDCEGG